MNRSSHDSTSPQFDPLSRRNFLKWSGGCASLSSTAILSQLLNLQLTQSAVAQEGDTSDYKALVCVFLLGGVDSFNMVTPYEDDEHAIYQSVRSGLALSKDPANPEILPIPVDINNLSGRQIGIHAGMPEIKSLYDAGNAAVVANVGSLVFPTTKTEYVNKSVKLPLGLFSHSDLIQHWQTSVPQSRSQVTGWGGRMADMLSAEHAGSKVSMNISINGLNIFQTGTNVVPYAVGTGGATSLYGYNNGQTRDRIYRQLTDHMYPTDTTDALTTQYSDLLQRTLGKTKRVSIDAAAGFSAATNAINLVTTFPGGSLSDQLKMVAKTIAARGSGQGELNQTRQIFFVSAGGWDHHDEVKDAQAGMLPVVSKSLKAFYEATVELGVENNVTTFTASDFGRTLTSNGNGSDHAWGGNHFVIGGSVDGGKVHGSSRLTDLNVDPYPTNLAIDNLLDAGRGRLIPTTSVDEYNAELAMWFGIDNSLALEDVLPNIRNFYASNAGGKPIGFMS